jgi:hypothetical protein
VYYTDFWGSAYQTQDLKGVSWLKYTPMKVEIYADTNSIPNTTVAVRDIADNCPDSEACVDDLQGQQLYPISNGINIQRSAIKETGAQGLPAVENIIVATAPEFKEFQASSVSSYSPKTYLFDKSSYDTRINYFFTEKRASNTLFNFIDPWMAFWTGYDKFSWVGGICGRFSTSYVNGYCKVSGWNGLYQEVTQPRYAIRYDPTKQKLIAENIQYGAEVNLEIPSETVKSLAVLRGVGQPVITVDITDAIREGDSKYLTVTVKNIGDTDGFSIVPVSKSGRLIFTPASYTSQSIPYNTQKVFRFVMTVAGKETSELSAREDISVAVQAEHNTEKVVKETSVDISYKSISESQPSGTPTGADAVKPTGADTMDLNKTKSSKGQVLKWYETPQAFLLGGLVMVLIIVAWRRYNEY